MSIDKKKLVGQIAILLSIAAVFAIFNISVYLLFTKRCLPVYSEEMQAKSIELDRPFGRVTRLCQICRR